MPWLVLLALLSSTLQEAPSDPRLHVADSVFRAGDPARALELMEDLDAEWVGEGKDPYEALWRGSSYALALGIVEQARLGATDAYRRALDLARRARSAQPERVEGRYWEVAALGRLALATGPREASGYAEAIRDGAREILARAPTHGGAHHALGKLQLEIMSLSGVARFVGRAVLGVSVLGEADWEDAERHLVRAVELEPSSLLFRLDLARLHRARGRAEVARRILERLVTMGDPSADTPPERVFRREARELLEAIR